MTLISAAGTSSANPHSILVMIFVATYFGLAMCCGCGKKPPPLPADLAPFAGHLTFTSEEDQPTGVQGVRNHGLLYRVDMPFEDALKQLTPILQKAGWEAIPTIRAADMRTAGFIKTKSKEQYMLSHFDSERTGTCTLVHSFQK